MADMMKNNEQVTQLLNSAISLCTERRHQFVMPEHLLYCMTAIPEMQDALTTYAVQPHELTDQLKEFFKTLETVPVNVEFKPAMSQQTAQLLHLAFEQAYDSGKDEVGIPHYVSALFKLEESWASYILKKALNDDTAGFLALLVDEYRSEQSDEEPSGDKLPWESSADEPKKRDRWKELVTCVNDDVANHNPLIGREAELERTIQVLCRKDKNNPLHVGEPGVGKTALVYGLAERINNGEVPERLKNCRIYAMDMGSMLAGTQYRGDFARASRDVTPLLI